MYVDPLLLFSSGQNVHLIFYALFPTYHDNHRNVKSLKIGLFIYVLCSESEKCQVGTFHSELKLKVVKLATFTQPYFPVVVVNLTTTKIINIFVSP